MNQKRKRLTQKERKERAQVKKKLQKEGLLPPDKPRLNRKRFKKEVRDAWDNEMNLLYAPDSIFLERAITWMLADVPSVPVTPEQVGLLKTMKIALELKRFYKRSESLEEPHTIGEEYERIKPIIDL